MNREVLCRPFPPELVKQRQGQGGKMLSYVETASVIARLNAGCDAWSFEILEHQILENEVLVVAKLTADGVVKTAFGGSSITRDRDGKPVSIADDAKSAGSDALKKAASLLGVALELYGGAAAAEPATPARTAAQPVEPSDRLTGKQYAALQSIARRQNIDRDDLADLLDERFHKNELGHLTRREASALMTELTGSNGNAHP